MLRIPLILLALILSFPASSQELRILTSFPTEVSDTYASLWRRLDPDTDIRILNKNTVAGINEILRGNDRQFDIFWASSPEAFEIMRRNNVFATENVCGETGPTAVEPFALSSLGWARRNDNNLFMPGEWNDLLKPIYRDKIAMARPARSGTTHMLVEQLLQLRGWEEGWAYLLELSGNISTLTARSFGVPDGLVSERFDIGLTIDFLTQSRGDVLQFRYGRPVVLVAAQVGILQNGKRSDKACEFVRMVLSREGQMALLEPEISRIPYDASIRAEVADHLPRDVVESLKLSWLDYDAKASSDQYWAVNALFDLMIAERLVERRDLWRRYRALEENGPGLDLREIKRLLTTVIVSQAEAIEASSKTKDGLSFTALAGRSDFERELTQDWRKRVDELLDQADRALGNLERQAAE